jgi:ribosome maturation factor RimP
VAVSDKLEALLAPLVEDLGYEFVGIEYQSNPKNRLIRLYIDRPEVGVGVDDCERVSHEVSALLDVEDPVSGQYTLEVSSPGIERPLFKAAHFLRFVGEDARVLMNVPVEGRRKFKGRIVDADERQVVLEVDGAHRALPVSDIQRAALAPDVDALLAEKRRQRESN